jgi:uncharacterized protein (TIGR02996 family)
MPPHTKGTTAKPAKGKAKVVTPAGPVRNAELEKAILVNPDDPEPYLVYADWLQGQGEIRGELIVLQHARKTKEANALIRKFGDWFLGSFEKTKPQMFTLEWQYGYIKKATIGWSPFTYDLEDEYDEDEGGEDPQEVEWPDRCKQLLTDFLKLPSAQFLQELELGCIPGEGLMDSGPLAEAIEAAKPPCLRKLYISNTGDWGISSTRTAIPDSKSIKGLRSLYVRGGNVTIGKLDLPELVEFKIQSGSLHAGELKAIATAKWPKLETLEIWCGDPNYGATGGVKELAPIFAATGLSKLRHLRLKNCPFADEAVAKLIKSKILPQLETLDLSMGNLSDRGVDTMVAHKEAFASLAMLELDDSALTEISKPKLKGLAKKTNYGKRQSPDRALPRDPAPGTWSYVAVGE